MSGLPITLEKLWFSSTTMNTCPNRGTADELGSSLFDCASDKETHANTRQAVPRSRDSSWSSIWPPLSKGFLRALAEILPAAGCAPGQWSSRKPNPEPTSKRMLRRRAARAGTMGMGRNSRAGDWPTGRIYKFHQINGSAPRPHVSPWFREKPYRKAATLCGWVAVRALVPVLGVAFIILEEQFTQPENGKRSKRMENSQVS